MLPHRMCSRADLYWLPECHRSSRWIRAVDADADAGAVDANGATTAVPRVSRAVVAAVYVAFVVECIALVLVGADAVAAPLAALPIVASSALPVAGVVAAIAIVDFAESLAHSHTEQSRLNYPQL